MLLTWHDARGRGGGGGGGGGGLRGAFTLVSRDSDVINEILRLYANATFS